MEIISYNIHSINDLISQIRTRTAMYTGDNKLSSLRSFIDGFRFALNTHSIEINENEPLPFWFFHEWVARYYHWGESTAGWCYMILKENNNDEEKSLKIFFELYDQFSKIKIIHTQQMILNQQHIDFHYSEECKTKVISDWKARTKEPVYKNPTAVRLFELSDHFGFVYQVTDGNKKKWERTVFEDELSAKKEITGLFGDFST